MKLNEIKKGMRVRFRSNATSALPDIDGVRCVAVMQDNYYTRATRLVETPNIYGEKDWGSVYATDIGEVEVDGKWVAVELDTKQVKNKLGQEAFHDKLHKHAGSSGFVDMKAFMKDIKGV